jgi:hypothetical protein
MTVTQTTANDPTLLTLDTLASHAGSLVLQLGDNDSSSTWGGGKRPKFSGRPVHELQSFLRAVGAMSAAPDGDFGRKTRDGLKRFQWYLNRVAFRLRVAAGAEPLHGALEAYTQPSGVLVDGFLREGTLSEILSWRTAGAVCTSPLVRLGLGTLPKTELSSSFTVLAHPSAGVDEVLVNQDFIQGMNMLDNAAILHGVTLRLNQTFRVQDQPVSGAVVTPATRSQHLIGHAVDLNIVDGETVNTSNLFWAGNATANAKALIQTVKQAGLRWGGDFGTSDPPHFDLEVPASSEDYDFNFHFAQRSFAAQHPVRIA